MMGANVGPNPVLDQTGWRAAGTSTSGGRCRCFGPAMANTGDRITLFDAVDKQLGLKLEEKQVPTPVIVVDSVNQKPSEMRRVWLRPFLPFPLQPSLRWQW